MNHVLIPGNDGHNGHVYHLPDDENPDEPKCHHNKIHDSKYLRKDPDIIPGYRVCKNCTETYERPYNTGPKTANELEDMDPSEVFG